MIEFSTILTLTISAIEAHPYGFVALLPPTGFALVAAAFTALLALYMTQRFLVQLGQDNVELQIGQGQAHFSLIPGAVGRRGAGHARR